MRKRIICLLAALSLLVCGCGAKRAYKANNNPVIETETETENTTEVRTEAETEIETETLDVILPEREKADWTILMYICASDLESEDGSASNNLSEISDVRFDGNVNMVIEAGGAKEWKNNLKNDKLTRIVCENNKLNIVDELDNASMGNPDTLSDFIIWGTEEYPAENYFLIIWNHGLVDFGGIAYDENYNDAISFVELGEAIIQSDVKFDMIGFDCCLCASYEMAKTISGYCDYMIASEDLIPGEGWDYKNWLNYLVSDSDVSAEKLGKKICDEYIKKYRFSRNRKLITLSLCDMKKFNTLNDRIIEMCIELNENVSDVNKLREFLVEVNSSESYGQSDLFDIKDLAYNTKGVISGTYMDLCSALEEFVIYNVAGDARTKSNGLSIFLPINDASEKTLDKYAQWSDNESILQFLDLIYTDWNAPSWVYERNFEERNDEIYDYKVLFDESIVDGYVTLDFESGFEYIEDAEFELFLYDRENDEITLLGFDNNAVVEKNKIVDNFGGYWLSIDGYYCAPELISSNDEYNIYLVPVKYNGKETELCITYSFEDEEYYIAGVYSNSINDESSRLMDLEEGDEIIPIFYGNSFTDDEDFSFEGGTIKYSEDLVVEDIELFDGEYIFRFDLTDVFGKHYYSDYYSMEIEGDDIYTSVFER